MSELVISDLEVWRGDYCACAGWSARIEAGQLLQLRGGNGAGKTSLLRVLAGLTQPEAGSVRFGEAGWSPQSADYRERLRYVAHRDGVKAELGVRENLSLSASLLLDASAASVEAALEVVGLNDLADRRAADLSAGQRRRLALARLLVGASRLWLLDEPLVALDHDGVGLVAELIRQQLANGGIVAVATHQTLPLAGLNTLSLDLPQRARDVH